MNREFHIRFTLSDVLKLLLASPVVVVFIFCMFALPWDSKDAPAWVQAIGSIVAIVIAIAVPYVQRQHALEAQADAEFRVRSDGYFAAISLVEVQIRLLERCEVGWGWSSSYGLRDPERLVEDLVRNQRQMEGLSIDSLGYEMVCYLLMVKEVAGFGGHFASTLATAGQRVSDPLRLLGLEAARHVAELKKARDEIEEMSGDLVAARRAGV